jgi:RHS repeat-associated protein
MGVTTASNTLDAAGRVVETADASGTVTHSGFGVLGDEVRSWRSSPTTSALADWHEQTVNAAGSPLVEVTKASDGATVSVVAHAYDAAGREIKADDSSVPGAEVTAYDAQGNVSQVWDEGADTSLDAASTRTSYDAEGRESSALAPGAASASFTTTYTADGQVAGQADADGEKVTFGYDDAGDLATQTVQTDTGQSSLAIESDQDGRPVEEVDSEGTTETSRYDLDGNEVASVLGGQAASTVRFNCLGWPMVATDFDGTVTRTSYDALGRATCVDVGGQRSATEYDGCGRVVRQTDSSRVSTVHTYDCFGDDVACVESSGSLVLRRTDTEYDAARRTSAQRVFGLGGKSARQRTLAYDADGRVTVVECRGQDGIITSVANGTGELRSLSGTIFGRSFDWSVTATDAAGRAARWESSGSPVPITSSWTQAGQPLQAQVGSGTVQSGYSAVSGKRTREAVRSAASTAMETTDYRYDNEGRLVTAITDGVSTTFAYDPDTGALRTRTRGADPGTALQYDEGTGRLRSAGNRVYRSDALGRRSSAGTTANPLETTYEWSGDRLARVAGPWGTAAYVYDGSGQRLRSTVASGALTTVTDYDYDGTRLLGLSAARSDGATWTIQYVYEGDGRLQEGVYRSGSTSVAFLVQVTARGDVRELLDVQGAPFATYAYDAYGLPTNSTVSGSALVSASTAAQIAERQRLRYAGYMWDSESGLYYCSARYYDPFAAAFISKDPDRADGERSAYQYCSGDPVDNIDPTGCDVWGYKPSDSFYSNLKRGEYVLVRYAMSRVGGRYVFGAKARNGHEWRKGPLDCSGLTAAAYRVAHRVEKRVWPVLPDGSVNQHDASKSLGFRLAASRLKIGDLAFLHNGGKESGKVHHVGVYVGHGWVVEARGRKWGVVKTSVKAFNRRGADWHRARKKR